jgi:hypothetical protein
MSVIRRRSCAAAEEAPGPKPWEHEPGIASDSATSTPPAYAVLRSEKTPEASRRSRSRDAVMPRDKRRANGAPF